MAICGQPTQVLPQPCKASPGEGGMFGGLGRPSRRVQSMLSCRTFSARGVFSSCFSWHQSLSNLKSCSNNVPGGIYQTAVFETEPGSKAEHLDQIAVYRNNRPPSAVVCRPTQDVRAGLFRASISVWLAKILCVVRIVIVSSAPVPFRV